MKRMLMRMLFVLALVSLLAGAAIAEEAKVYTGSARGMFGDVIVEVTLGGDAIMGIEVKSHEDTPHLAAAAAKEVPSRIVETQSVKVDTASGATVTSYGVINAVRDALKQAGVEDMFNTAVQAVEKTEGETEHYDVVVVGGGGSGMTAATYAAKSGANVLLLEKLAYTGGSTSLSGGGIVIGGSRVNEEIGFDYNAEEFVQFYVNYANSRTDRPEGMWINEALVEKIGAISGETFDEFLDNGLPMPEGWSEGPFIQLLNLGVYSYGKGHMVFDTWAEGRGMTSFGDFTISAPKNASKFYHTWLTAFTEKNGVEIRLNSPVTELVIEDGAVKGVRVEDREKTYTVTADKVILACGGMEQNAELVAQYAPEIAGSQVAACPGNTGDFVALTEGLDVVLTGYGSVAQIGLDARYEANTTYGSASLNSCSFWINAEGERFTTEAGHYYEMAREIKKQTDLRAWGIADSNNASAAVFESANAAGLNYKADTIEELAEMIKVPAEKLLAVVEQYNADYEAGQDDSAFGLSHVLMKPVAQGPFYAQAVRPILMFTLTGLKVNENCQILNKNGEVIPNLYGAGEVIFGNTFFDNYIYGGGAIQNAVMSGRIAGEHAAQNR